MSDIEPICQKLRISPKVIKNQVVRFFQHEVVPYPDTPRRYDHADITILGGLRARVHALAGREPLWSVWTRVRHPAIEALHALKTGVFAYYHTRGREKWQQHLP